MTTEEFREILARGYEVRAAEFKGPGSRTDRHLFSKVVRAVLGMANKRDGGRVIIGVEDSSHVITPRGLSGPDLATWNYDEVLAGISEYADPYVEIEVKRVSCDGMEFATIRVHEFEEVPVLCKRDYQDVLRRGACYVRSRHKPETSEVPSHADMRDLLDLATEKGIRRFFRQTHATQRTRDDAAAFAAQLEAIK